MFPTRFGDFRPDSDDEVEYVEPSEPAVKRFKPPSEVWQHFEAITIKYEVHKSQLTDKRLPMSKSAVKCKHCDFISPYDMFRHADYASKHYERCSNRVNGKRLNQQRIDEPNSRKYLVYSI
jgi:hypothetical protein